ncbi:MAG: hypothetical protein ACOY0T_05900 [Myxococcota bacterium]
MDYRLIDGIFIVVHAARSPSDLEWASFVNELRTTSAHHHRAAIGYSYGGGPDGKQRGMLKEFMKVENRKNVPVALLTNSVMVRGLGVALSWLVRTIKVFPLSGEQAAFEFLGLSVDESARVHQIRVELERGLDIASRLSTVSQGKA